VHGGERDARQEELSERCCVHVTGATQRPCRLRRAGDCGGAHGEAASMRCQVQAPALRSTHRLDCRSDASAGRAPGLAWGPAGSGKG
jgi:hypothetical protein